MKLHASGEDYLEAILVLQKKLGMVRSVDVARHMEVTWHLGWRPEVRRWRISKSIRTATCSSC